jgi:hypothetical protein
MLMLMLMLMLLNIFRFDAHASSASVADARAKFPKLMQSPMLMFMLPLMLIEMLMPLQLMQTQCPCCQKLHSCDSCPFHLLHIPHKRLLVHHPHIATLTDDADIP